MVVGIMVPVTVVRVIMAMFVGTVRLAGVVVPMLLMMSMAMVMSMMRVTESQDTNEIDR